MEISIFNKGKREFHLTDGRVIRPGKPISLSDKEAKIMLSRYPRELITTENNEKKQKALKVKENELQKWQEDLERREKELNEKITPDDSNVIPKGKK